MLPLMCFGALFLVRAWRAARDVGRQRAATLLLLTLLGWVLAQSMNAQVWQRYYEPMILIALAILVSLGWRAQDGERPHAARMISIMLLVVIQLGLCAARVYWPLLR